jgi:SpoVK/Ycf46/Vps4 family AAA+-type ATPase
MANYRSFLEILDKGPYVFPYLLDTHLLNITTKPTSSTTHTKQDIDKLCLSINCEYDNHVYIRPPINDVGPYINNKHISYPIHTVIKPLITVFIADKVTNIEDLLNIINKYPYNPLNQYNIDLKSLHNIKDPLTTLNNMIGMTNLKNNVVDQLLYFIQEFHKSTSNSDCKVGGDYMHTIIYGPPGTGKTEVAKIIGSIYSKLGILNKGTFKKVTRGDLIAGYLGQTALKTKDVIKDALGGVLFIDEAYALGNSDKQDSFSKECIDTLCEALSDHKDNLMVIIAGYEKELDSCFFNYNQGLNSRFVWRFKTDEYNGDALYNIFLKKVGDVGWSILSTEINAGWFRKNKEHFPFFGRDIETLLSKIKISHSKRVFGEEISTKKLITISDLDNGLVVYLQNKPSNEDRCFRRDLLNTLYS